MPSIKILIVSDSDHISDKYIDKEQSKKFVVYLHTNPKSATHLEDCQKEIVPDELSESAESLRVESKFIWDGKHWVHPSQLV